MSKPINPQPTPPQAHIVNEKGEEIPITDEMVAESMADVKLQSIGVHTGFTKIITDDMLPDPEK
jgi:hypothetical protein